MSFTSSTFGRYSAKWLIIVGIFELALAGFFVFLGLQIPFADFGMYLTAAILGITGVVLVLIGLRVRNSAAAADHILTSGVSGQATITGVTQTGMYLNEQPRIKMDLLVTLPGQDPYAAEHSEFVPLILLNRVSPGATLPVRVDPANPQKVVIDWQGSTQATFMQQMGMQQLAGAPSPGATPPLPAAGSSADESLSQVQAALAGAGAAVPATYATATQGNYTIDQLRAWLRANGLEAQARVDFLEDTGKIVGDERLYTMEMTLMVPGSAPEKLPRSAAMVPLTAMHKLREGMTIPVRVAAENHHLLTMEWEKV